MDRGRDSILEYIMGVGTGAWPGAYSDVSFLPESGPLENLIAEEDYRFLDLVSTVSCRLLYELGEARLINLLVGDGVQGEHFLHLLSISNAEPSTTGWIDWVWVYHEYMWEDGPLAYGGTDAREVGPSASEIVQSAIDQAIRDLESGVTLAYDPSTSDAAKALRVALGEVLSSDPEIGSEHIAEWLDYASCKRGCCPAGYDQLNAGIAGVLTHFGPSLPLEQVRDSLIEYLRGTPFDVDGECWIKEFNHESFRPETGCPWSEVSEDTQLAILEQLIAVADDHPAWFPIALIARHPESAPSVLRRAANLGIPEVVEALLMNDSYFPLKHAREILRTARDEGRSPSEVYSEVVSQGNPVVRRYAAKDPNCPATVLELLAGDPDRSIQLQLAFRSDTPPQALAKLGAAGDSKVILLLALNPHSPQELLKSLATGGDPMITHAVLANGGADPQTRALAHLLLQ